jgi:hypothetical protein
MDMKVITAEKFVLNEFNLDAPIVDFEKGTGEHKTILNLTFSDLNIAIAASIKTLFF